MNWYVCVSMLATLTTVQSFGLPWRQCEHLTNSECHDLGYNFTTFPNVFRHETQHDAGNAIAKFYPLIKVDCAPAMKLFVCSAYLPVCRDPLHADEVFPPCRSLCESAESGCRDLMEKFGFIWPGILKCDRFPGDESSCIDRNPETGQFLVRKPEPTPVVTIEPTSPSSIPQRAPMSKLVHDLFDNYDSIVPPVLKGLNVSHGINLMRVVSFEDQVLTTYTFNSMGWTDGRLAWNPDQYDGIQNIRIPASKVWLPDIVVFNDASDYMPSQDINAVLNSDGSVYYVPKVTFRSYCDVKAKSSKKGRKVTCKIVFGSWTYDSGKLDVYNPDGGFKLGDLVQNPQWKLIASSVARKEKTYDCCPETYVTMEYSLTLKPVS